MEKGKSSVIPAVPLHVRAASSIVGKKEGDGPLGSCFDEAEADPMFGQKTWEEAESELQRRTAVRCLSSAGLAPEEIRYLFAGDLLGQLAATSFGLYSLEIPLLGLYSACATMGEALFAALLAAGNGKRMMALSSSHFASAERQFRFPLSYGNQRPLSSTWTVTGCGAVILEENADGRQKGTGVSLTGGTAGRIVNLDFRDSMNMGAAMAPAAADTILQHFRDFGTEACDYDRIFTGDLGYAGQRLLLRLMEQAGHPLDAVHEDCGILIYRSETQDTHCGGSGCGCSASVLCGHILPRVASGEWKRVLFVPTGALLSPATWNEGQGIPGIAHAAVFEHLPAAEKEG